MRHRLANPIAIISGMAQTLCRADDLDTDLARAMIDVIRQQSDELRVVSLEPRAIEPVEQALDPWPGHIPASVVAAEMPEGVR